MHTKFYDQKITTIKIIKGKQNRKVLLFKSSHFFKENQH